MKKKLLKNSIFLSFIFIFIFYFIFELNYYRHWSSIWDQDLILIHNSLLLNSGLKAEYHDHPGHTLLILLATWINLLEFLNILHFSSYDDLDNVFNLEKEFTNLVIFSRFINFLIAIIFAYLLNIITKLFSIDKFSAFLLICFTISSLCFLNSISHIRTELLSSSLIFLSLIYQLKLIRSHKLKKKYIFLMGFFFLLSIFCKFQSLIIFLFFPLFFSLFKKKKLIIDKKDTQNKALKYFTILFTIFFLFLIWYKYVKGLNILLLPLGLLYFILYLKYLNYYSFKNKSFYSIFIFYFLLGLVTCSLFLFSLKPFHTNNISVIVNFLGTSSMFVQGTNPYLFSADSIIKLLLISANNFSNYLTNIFEFIKYDFLIILIITLVSLFIFKKKLPNKLNLFNFIIILTSIIAIFSVRPILNYVIFIIPIIFIYFSGIFICLKKNIINSILIFLIIFNVFNSFSFIKINKYRNDLNYICGSDMLEDKKFWMQTMRKKVFLNLCK